MNNFWKTATTILATLFVVGLGVVVVAKLGFDFQSLSWKEDKPKEALLQGEIFIVTNGRENIKLGAVTIQITNTSGNSRAYVPDYETKSNSDGKFSIRLPLDNYKVVAQSRRLVFGEIEKYYWEIPITLTEAGNTIILSNDNLCEKCVPK